MLYAVIIALFALLGVFLGAYIADRLQHEKPLLPQKQEKNIVRPARKDEDTEDY